MNVTSKHRKAAIFDLDGVLVDTARLHFKAWQRIAEELGITFTELDNERLKGISREASLQVLLGLGKRSLEPSEQHDLAERKNDLYVESLSALDEQNLLPGARRCLEELAQMGVSIALASASRNAHTVLDRLNISRFFAAIVDGACVRNAKPDAEIFCLAATKLGHAFAECVVFEDSTAGIQAAHAAGMFAVGIGDAEILAGADIIYPDLAHCDTRAIFADCAAGSEPW